MRLRKLTRAFVGASALIVTSCSGDDSSGSTSAPGTTTPSASEESDAGSPTTQASDATSTTAPSSAPPSTVEPADSAAAEATGVPNCDVGPSDAEVGDASVREITVGEVDRSYLLYVPTAYEEGQDPFPLVVNLHGGTADASGQRWFTEFDEIAEEEGVVVAYGEAPGGFWSLDGDLEREYVTAVVDDVEATLCVDPERVFMMGFSQGGDLSTLLSCTMADRVAAFASVGVLNHHAIACPDSSPVRVVAIVGATDPVTIEGLSGVPDPDPPQPLSDEIASWVETNDCDPVPAESMPAPDVSRREFVCAEGGTLVVYLHPGGHIWPRSPFDAVDANAVAWDFLSEGAP